MNRLTCNCVSKIASKSVLNLCVSVLLLLSLPLVGCGADSGSPASPSEHRLSYRILEVVDHDQSMFTQGLEMADGYFYESAGLYGQSRIRRYLPSGDIEAEFKLPANEFAEGLSIQDEMVVLLTWQNRKVYFLNKASLQPISTETIAGEGWGAAFVNDRLAVSNGSDAITFYKLMPFEPKAQIKVTGYNRSWQKINELEFANGLIWANVWQENVIIAIDPTTGHVEHQFDLTAIVEQNTQIPFRESLNGIAYDKERDAFWLTGKLWPNRYLIEFDLNQ